MWMNARRLKGAFVLDREHSNTLAVFPVEPAVVLLCSDDH